MTMASLKPITRQLKRHPLLKRVLITVAALVVVVQTYTSIYSTSNQLARFKSDSIKITTKQLKAGESQTYVQLLHNNQQAHSQKSSRHNAPAGIDEQFNLLRSQLAKQYPYQTSVPIPQNIWQTWKNPLDSPNFPKTFHHFVEEWLAQPSKFHHHLVPDELATDLIEFLYGGIPSVIKSWEVMPKSILRADFFRYLILFARGGIYSDIDTVPLKPISEWVSHNETLYGEQNNIGLVIGIEADPDRDDWADFYVHRIQFCQWTMLAKPGHPMLGELIAKITEVTLRKYSDGTLNKSDDGSDGVMDWTGPGIWTKEIFRYFNDLLMLKGSKLTKINNTPVNKYNKGYDLAKNGFDWRYFTLLNDTAIIDDVMILPITSFSPGVGHMGSRGITDDWAYVRHMFEGSWKHDSERSNNNG